VGALFVRHQTVTTKKDDQRAYANPLMVHTAHSYSIQIYVLHVMIHKYQNIHVFIHMVADRLIVKPEQHSHSYVYCIVMLCISDTHRRLSLFHLSPCFCLRTGCH
jgi:hypothetical protein